MIGEEHILNVTVRARQPSPSVVYRDPSGREYYGPKPLLQVHVELLVRVAFFASWMAHNIRQRMLNGDEVEDRLGGRWLMVRLSETAGLPGYSEISMQFLVRPGAGGKWEAPFKAKAALGAGEPRLEAQGS